MHSLEELDTMRTETISGMNGFYESLHETTDPVEMVRRIQGKVTDLIDYILALEAYINKLPSTPKNRSSTGSASKEKG